MARTNPLQFIQQVRAETAKVVWPTRRETMLTTVMVMIMAALFATFFSKFESTLTEYQRIAISFRYLNPGSGTLRSPCRLPRSNAPTKQNGAQANRSAPASPSGSAPLTWSLSGRKRPSGKTGEQSPGQPG